MKAKNYLKKLKNLEARIQRTEDIIENLRNQAEKCTTAFGGNGGASSQIQDRMAECISKYLDISERYFDDIEESQKLFDEIVEQINNLDNTLFSEILFYRYIEGASFDDIAKIIGYSYRYTINLHGKALYAFQKKYLSCDKM